MTKFTFSFKKTPTFEEVERKEWLLSNGIGGFSSSTISGLNTRKYHGLLVASLTPPNERIVLVSKIEETLLVDKEKIALNTTQYPGIVHPKGFEKLSSFTRDPFPTSVFKHDKLKLEKTIYMHYGHNTVIVEYKNLSSTPLSFTVRPHFVSRDYHGLQDHVQNCFAYNQKGKNLSISSVFNTQNVHWHHSSGKFKEGFIEYLNNEYLRDAERGLEFKENTASVGFVEVKLEPKEIFYCIFSTEAAELKLDIEEIKKEEKARLKKLVPTSIKNEFTQDLIRTFDQFLVNRNSTKSKTILAGYPWFTDWGRDTMIAIRGAILPLDKHDEFKEIIKTFFSFIKNGIIPNRFPDYKENPEYNTIDATLWAFVVVYEYYEKTKDKKFLTEIFPVLKDIIKNHIAGTLYNIHVTELGFLKGGNAHMQLTWMDAKVGHHVETPRHGCPVEIQGLWYNALKTMDFFSQEMNEKTGFEITENIKKIEKNFKRFFYNEAGYFNDVIIPDKLTDTSLRSNQLFLLNMPFRLLSKECEDKVIHSVKEKLFTPLGIRTLSPDDSKFRATYEGDQWSRDTAYHQGTIWPFLLGDYYAAYLRIHNNSDEAKNYVTENLKPLAEHFYNDGCIQGISEIFDGLTPTIGKGCFHQAWSVTGILGVILKNNIEVVIE